MANSAISSGWDVWPKPQNMWNLHHPCHLTINAFHSIPVSLKGVSFWFLEMLRVSVRKHEMEQIKQVARDPI